MDFDSTSLALWLGGVSAALLAAGVLAMLLATAFSAGWWSVTDQAVRKALHELSSFSATALVTAGGAVFSIRLALQGQVFAAATFAFLALVLALMAWVCFERVRAL